MLHLHFRIKVNYCLAEHKEEKWNHMLAMRFNLFGLKLYNVNN